MADTIIVSSASARAGSCDSTPTRPSSSAPALTDSDTGADADTDTDTETDYITPVDNPQAEYLSENTRKWREAAFRNMGKERAKELDEADEHRQSMNACLELI